MLVIFKAMNISPGSGCVGCDVLLRVTVRSFAQCNWIVAAVVTMQRLQQQCIDYCIVLCCIVAAATRPVIIVHLANMNAYNICSYNWLRFA